MKNEQLANELLRYIDGKVEETPKNVREFDMLTRVIVARLKDRGRTACENRDDRRRENGRFR